MEAGTRARASRTALKIRCNSSSEYLRTLVAASGVLAMEGFVLEGPTGWSDNLSPDSGDGKESRGATEGATEGAIEGCSRRGRPWPRTEVILKLISSKNFLPNGLADPLGMEKLEL